MPEFIVQSEQVQGAAGSFFIRSLAPLASDVIIHYVMAGTAEPLVHYQALPGQVTMLAGESVVEIPVVLLSNVTFEKPLSIVLLIVDDSGYTIGTPNNATIMISDLVTAAGVAMQEAISRLCHQLEAESAMMDASLTKQVTLPVFPKLVKFESKLRDVCLMLTRYALATKPGQMTDDIRQRYEDATAWLRSVARREVCLTDGQDAEEKSKICSIPRKTIMKDLAETW